MEGSHTVGGQKLLGRVLVLAMLAVLGGAAMGAPSAAKREPDGRRQPSGQAVEVPAARPGRNRAGGEAIIVDHTCTDIRAVPQEWIEEAKRTLHIGYGHTSHGSQLTSGMTGLVEFANQGGLGLSLPEDIFLWNRGGTGGALDLREGDGYGTGDLDHDCGYYPNWVNETREYLGPPDPVTGRGTGHPEINVIMWSWCGQVSGRTEQTMLETYLWPMSELEEAYWDVVFVYMTGHADGTGEEGNLHLRNQQIREYCMEQDKVLYDFYDMECYDPDGNYYGDKRVNDNCDYDSDGDGSLDGNWAIEWQGGHSEGVDWYGCSCAHSQALNCNQKAYGVWWLWARLAGWDGGVAGGSEKGVSRETAVHGETLTYTVVVRDVGAPPSATVYLTDEVPSGLAYVGGSLAATGGVVSEEDAPVLRWSGVLMPAPVVTVSYAVRVSAVGAGVITNRAVIAVPGYETITRTATVRVTSEPPGVGPFEPQGGSGRVGEWADLTTTYSDPNGGEDIGWALFLLDREPPVGSGGLAAAYVQPQNVLWLRDGGVCRPGQGVSLRAQAVTLDCAHTTVSLEGEALIVNWRVRPEQCFDGSCGWNGAYGVVVDSTGLRDVGLMGWWRLREASGVGQEGGPAARWGGDGGSTGLARVVEELGREMEVWESRLGQ